MPWSGPDAVPTGIGHCIDQQATEYKAGLAAYQEGLTAYEAQKQAAEQQFAEEAKDNFQVPESHSL